MILLRRYGFGTPRRLLLCAIVLTFSNIPLFAQLSQNSGINPNDTYAIFDVTTQNQSTISLTDPVYDARSGTTTTSLQLSPSPKHLHVEVGYDTNDRIVMNLFLTDTGDPTVSEIDDVSKVSLVGNNLVLYDQSGAPVPIVLPENAPLPQPLAFLGWAAGSSVLSGLVVTDPVTFATQMNAQLRYFTLNQQGSGTTVAEMTVPIHAAGGGTTVLDYQNFGTSWTLASATITPTLSTAQASRTLQLSNMAWSDNTVGDARRAAKAPSVPPPPSSWSLTTGSIPLYSAATGSSQSTQNSLGIGPNVTFQHGIFSSSATWSRMNAWLSGDFQFGTVLLPSLRSTDALSSQATDLVSLMTASNQKNYIIIGHSQGGLIGRDVGQRTALTTLLTSGVITLETPNTGALLAMTSRIAAANGLRNVLNNLLADAGCNSYFDNYGCFIAYLVANFGAPVAVNYAVDAAIPASGDLIPGSPYLTTLNHNSEVFTRVGVAGHSNKRWVLMRLGGDAICNPESNCGGRAFYLYTEIVYFSFRICEFVSLVDWDFDTAAFCANVADRMDDIDGYWNHLTSTSSDSSDGIVQGSGQTYSGAAPYTIGGADSHTGATKSDKARSVLDQVLAAQFRLVGRSCTFSISPASASFLNVGGAGTVRVTAGANCPWSAISNVPWVTITSGFSGTTSGTVSFSVDINLSNITRSGSLAVASNTFAITQPGISTSAATGGVTVSGSEGMVSIPNDCYQTPSNGADDFSPLVLCKPFTKVYDTGFVSVIVNGHSDSVAYGQNSTPDTLASALVAAINADSAAPVQAGLIGTTTVFLVSKATSAANYPFSSSVSSNYSQYLLRPSFATTTSGPNLTGSP
jgi:pimeloyl-ACP methyl ester carboxylesterase